MNHRSLPLLIAGAAGCLLLAGCNKSSQTAEQGLSQQDVAETMDSVKLTPGEWESTTTIQSVDLQGMPAGASRDAIDQMVGKETTTRYCITPEEAKKPSAQLIAGQKDASCTYQDFTMEGGQLTAKMTCQPTGTPGTMNMTMDGPYASDNYDLKMTMETAGLPGGITMTMKASNIGKHVGDCES